VSRTPRVVNLTVHGIGVPTRPCAPDEAQTWVSVEQFEQVLDAIGDSRNVRITFDDGNSSDIELALPRLLERGLRATFFPLAGRLGEPGWLDASAVRELRRAGMAIGSHGWGHRDWRALKPAEAVEEFVEAPRVLRTIAGAPVSAVAVPFGSYDRHVLRRLRMARAERVYTSDGGRARAGAWVQARTSLRHDLDAAWIARVLAPPSMPARSRTAAARLAKRVRG
jgi:peptidoglycan/xylan/chitin deacetylase (PgdA/CDA1 family)